MVKRLGTGRAVYSVSAVARMIGVPVATIRTWEDRYGLVIPDRSAGGHRLYRRDQVEQLKFVRACMADGATADTDCPSTWAKDSCARRKPDTGEVLRMARLAPIRRKVVHRPSDGGRVAGIRV